MKPAHQIHINDTNGDCHAACIASLLEIPIEAMPDFFADTPPYGRNSYVLRTKWLREQGLQEVYFLLGSFPVPEGYGILSVKSLLYPNATHAVVWKGDADGGNQIVHNPNPQDTWGLNIPNEEWVGFWVLAPLDPSLWVRKEMPFGA